MAARSLVLCYHAVTRAWVDRLAVSPERFARQIRLLAFGRRGGTAHDALERPHGVLHVTFDDGLVSVLDALPVLERAGLPVTVFACAAYGDGRVLSLPELAGDRHSEAGLRTLTWDELRALSERGVEIGSHTMTHSHLTSLLDAELDRELALARERVEDELGRSCRLVAYPFGEVDERVRRAAERAEYVAGFGLPGTRGDRFDFPRLGLYRRDGFARTAVKSTLLVSRLRRRRRVS